MLQTDCCINRLSKGATAEFLEKNFKRQTEIILRTTAHDEFYLGACGRILKEAEKFETKESQCVFTRIVKFGTKGPT